MDSQPTLSPSDRWSRHFHALKNYVERHGHARVPSSHKEPVELADGTTEYLKLGTWVAYMRSRKRKGELDEQRAGLLESLPGWEWGPLRPGPRGNDERNAEIKRMWTHERKSLREIAEQFGISRQRVHQVVHAVSPDEALEQAS